METTATAATRSTQFCQSGINLTMRLFGPLYDRALNWAGHPHAERYLWALSFAESSFFPIPPDVMLAPMCLANRSRAWRFAIITTLASVAGGVAGYAIGFYVFEAIEPWLRAMGYWSAYLRGKEWFDAWGGPDPHRDQLWLIHLGLLHCYWTVNMSRGEQAALHANWRTPHLREQFARPQIA